MKNGLKALFVAGFGPLVRDPGASRRLYGETLGLALESVGGDPNYLHAEGIEGVKHFPRSTSMSSSPIALNKVNGVGTRILHGECP